MKPPHSQECETAPTASNTGWRSSAGVFPRGLLASLLLIVGAVWSVQYLPMVDYPQHLAQVSLWARSSDPAWGFADWYQINPFTPYLLGYGLARLFEPFLGVETAMRLVLTLGLIGLPLATLALLRELELPEDLAVGSCLLVFGYGFTWGFFNYVLTVPLGIAFLAIVLRACRLGRIGTGGITATALGAVLLFFSHALVWLLMLVIGAVLVRRSLGSGPEARRLIMFGFAPSILLGAAWLALVRLSEPTVSYPTMWSSLDQAVTRFLELAGTLAGDPDLPAAWPLLLLAIAMTGISGLGIRRDLVSWLPFLIGLFLYFFGPFGIWGTSHLAQRIAVFLPILLLPALEPRSQPLFGWWRSGVLILVVGWLLMVGWRFQMFDREAREFEPVRAAIPAGSKLLGLIFMARSEFAPLYPYLHFPAYAQVDKPVMINFSFAFFLPEIVRYKSEARFGWRTPMELEPLKHYTIPGMAAYRLDWARDAAYSHILVRAEYDVAPQVFADSPWPWKLIASHGTWWLYEKVLPAEALQHR